MKTLAFLSSGAMALALCACGSNDSTADETADAAVADYEAPVVTETAVVRDSDGSNDSAPDTVSVGPDGVKVDIDSNGTRVQAGRGGASVSVDD